MSTTKDYQLGQFTIRYAEEILNGLFPHIQNNCNTAKASTLLKMENDVRKALKLKLCNKGFNYSPDTILYVIDAIVCWHTGRGSEYEW